MSHEARRGLQDELWMGYYRAIDLITVNVLWFLFTIPLITAVPALGGLFYATNRIAHGNSADWRAFWDGFRAYFWISWRWAAINTVVFAFLGVNFWFYNQADSQLLNALSLLIVLIMILWGEMQLFTFPLLIEQSDKRVITAMRNSAVILLRHSILALLTLILLLIIVVPSVLIIRLAWIVISASLCTLVVNRATIHIIDREQQRVVG